MTLEERVMLMEALVVAAGFFAIGFILAVGI